MPRQKPVKTGSFRQGQKKKLALASLDLHRKDRCHRAGGLVCVCQLSLWHEGLFLAVPSSQKQPLGMSRACGQYDMR